MFSKVSYHVNNTSAGSKELCLIFLLPIFNPLDSIFIGAKVALWCLFKTSQQYWVKSESLFFYANRILTLFFSVSLGVCLGDLTRS